MIDHDALHVFVGADVLEIMSVAMYAEPLVIYRELIQNAADSIDSAISSGLMTDSAARVSINLDSASRTASIVDNGAGLPNGDFDAQMTSFGASTKREAGYRGFRGIGRLAGLGHCKTLVFRSRSVGDKVVREARWSGSVVRDLLGNGQSVSLEDLTRKAVHLSSARATVEPEHFFEVRLEGVRRLGDDRLLDAHRIAAFLGEVAPVPFSKSFSKAGEIREKLLRRGPLLELELSVAGKTVVKPYTDVIEARAGRVAQVSEIEFVELPSINDGTAAYGWIGHHDYLGALRRDSPGRGLRVRSGNLQIGDEMLLAPAFPEERFNSWTVGEFHVFDPRLRPNARRDAFEPSIHVDNLYNQLRPYAASVARRCRTESRARNDRRKIDALTRALRGLDASLGKDSSPFAASVRKLVAFKAKAEIDQLQQVRLDRESAAQLESIERITKKLTTRKITARLTQKQAGRLEVLTWLYENASPDVFAEAVRAMRRAN